MHSAHIFVFGSNTAGRHGAGAARHAHVVYGAQMGVGEGLTGNAYALPTLDKNLRKRSLEEIGLSAQKLFIVALGAPNSVFQVTRVGCGLAGFTDEHIAPLFADAPRNCVLPLGWRAMNGEEPDVIPHIGDGA